MKGSSRRALGIGALVFVVLLGIGLWPRHVLISQTTMSEAIGPNGAEEVTWTASADCSILLGEYRTETYRKPPNAFLPDGALCGMGSGPRNALIVALVLTLTVTLVLLVWSIVSIPDEELDDDDELIDEEPH